MDSLVFALLLMHIEEYKKQMKKALDDGDDSKVDAAYTSLKTLQAVMQNIQTQLTLIQQAQGDETRAKNSPFNEGENPINENEGGSENED